jgi:hypothetical protein
MLARRPPDLGSLRAPEKDNWKAVKRRNGHRPPIGHELCLALADICRQHPHGLYLQLGAWREDKSPALVPWLPGGAAKQGRGDRSVQPRLALWLALEASVSQQQRGGELDPLAGFFRSIAVDQFEGGLTTHDVAMWRGIRMAAEHDLADRSYVAIYDLLPPLRQTSVSTSVAKPVRRARRMLAQIGAWPWLCWTDGALPSAWIQDGAARAALERWRDL